MAPLKRRQDPRLCEPFGDRRPAGTRALRQARAVGQVSSGDLEYFDALVVLAEAFEERALPLGQFLITHFFVGSGHRGRRLTHLTTPAFPRCAKSFSQVHFCSPKKSALSGGVN